MNTRNKSMKLITEIVDMVKNKIEDFKELSKDIIHKDIEIKDKLNTTEDPEDWYYDVGARPTSS